MDIGKDLAKLLAALRREAEAPVILLVVILALMVGIAWLDRHVNRHDPVMAAKFPQLDAPCATALSGAHPSN